MTQNEASSGAEAPSRTGSPLKLSLFWFSYYAGMGIFYPFFSLYLQEELGLSPSRVGWVLAAVPWVGLLAQPLWGRLADRTGSRRAVLAATLVGTAGAYAVLGLLPAFWPVFLGTVLLASFSTVVSPIGTAVSLASLDTPASLNTPASLKTLRGTSGGSPRFGLVRLWGTVGFLLTVIGFPLCLEPLRTWDPGPWHGLGWLFPLAALCTLTAVPSILSLPPSPGLAVRSRPGDTRRLLRHPPVVRLLLFTLAAHLFIQAPIQLFPLLITHRGGDASWISEMWIYMLLVEIPLLGFLGPSLRRIGPRGLLTCGFLSEGVRWLATAAIHDFAVFRWVQLLHGVGVAGILVGAGLYLEESVRDRSRATGQALVAVVAGVGMILSLTLGGWIFEALGAETPYWLAGGGALLLGLLACVQLPAPYRPPLDYT